MEGLLVDIMTEFYLSFGASLWSPDGGAGPFARLGEHAYPAGGYFSVKKSNQKSLGEDPETPYASVRPDRKVCDLPDLGLDDAYKVDF